MTTKDSATRSPRASTLGTAIYVLSGPLLWSAHLATVYVGHEIWCAPHVAPATAAVGVPALVIATTLACGGMITWILWQPRIFARALRCHAYPEVVDVFLRGVMRGLGGLALIGVLWAGSGIALLGPCR